MPKEQAIQTAIKRALLARGCWAVKFPAGPLAAQGVPDLLVSVPPNGQMCAIEVKRPGNRPTPRQQRQIDALSATGARAGVATSVKEALAIAGLE